MANSEWKNSNPHSPLAIRHSPKRKKEAERRKTLFRNLRSLAGCGTHPKRVPSGVPLRLLSKGLTHPKDSASDQASRSAAAKRAGYPAGTGPLAASTSRTGHSAGGLMSETAREPR